MNINYLLGMDIGTEKMTVSQIKLGVENPESKILSIMNTSNPFDKQVKSAVCKDMNGNWTLSVAPYAMNVLKGMVNDVKSDPLRAEAFQAFIKLVFDSLLSNNPHLFYNEVTDEKNFNLYIAYPPNWETTSETASRMPFVGKMLKNEVFQNAKILIDAFPEYAVSDGIVLYVHDQLCLKHMVS